MKREMERLRESSGWLRTKGIRSLSCSFTILQPIFLEKTSPFIQIAEENKVSAVVYSHCHGASRFGDSIRGKYHGIEYMLVSGDYLNFRPAMVLSIIIRICFLQIEFAVFPLAHVFFSMVFTAASMTLFTFLAE